MVWGVMHVYVLSEVDYFVVCVCFFFFFFFKQKTAYEIVDCDWSSDVCSSDLLLERLPLICESTSSALIVGSDPPARRLFRAARRVAGVSLPRNQEPNGEEDAFSNHEKE